MNAEKEVFITDWFLTPQIYLRRPWFKHQRSWLDWVFKKIAERGVKIHIILFKEDNNVLYNNSGGVEMYL